MKKCLNCKKDCRDNDKFCRTCGVEIMGNVHYITLSILQIFVIIGIIFILIVFIMAFVI